MISKKLLIPIIAVVAVVPVVLLLFSQSFFSQSQVLLNQKVTLTFLSEEREFYLSLKQGDKIRIQISVTGEPVDMQFARDPPFQLLVDRTEILSYDDHVTIPTDGTYVLWVGGWEHTTVHIIVTRV